VKIQPQWVVKPGKQTNKQTLFYAFTYIFSEQGSIDFTVISKKFMAQKRLETPAVYKGNTTLRPSTNVYQSKRRNLPEDEFPSFL
jgi:hypothetical protein